MNEILATDTLNQGRLKINENFTKVFNHTQTQWIRPITANLTIANNTNLNLLTLVSDTNKVANGTTTRDAYNILSNSIKIPYVGKPYAGQKLQHIIRVSFLFTNGSVQDCVLELKRTSDNTLIEQGVAVYRSADYSGQMITFNTYTSGSTDAFVNGGFYINIRNNSGSSIVIPTGSSIGILIQTIYEKPTLFI